MRSAQRQLPGFCASDIIPCTSHNGYICIRSYLYHSWWSSDRIFTAAKLHYQLHRAAEGTDSLYKMEAPRYQVLLSRVVTGP